MKEGRRTTYHIQCPFSTVYHVTNMFPVYIHHLMNIFNLKVNVLINHKIFLNRNVVELITNNKLFFIEQNLKSKCILKKSS